MSLEANKVFAAILLAGLIGMLTGFIADILVASHAPEETAIKIEGVGEKQPTGAASSQPKPAKPILGMLADADPSKGKSTFRQCSACHTIKKGGSHGVGPNLYNVVGGQIGGKDGFGYSSALKEKGGKWTYTALNKWLHNPNQYISGNNMGFGGLDDPQARANVIAYMRQHADNPPAMPTQEEIEKRQAEYKKATGGGSDGKKAEKSGSGKSGSSDGGSGSGESGSSGGGSH